jgi:hypothetical protein
MTPARPELAAHETRKSKGSDPHHGHQTDRLHATTHQMKDHRTKDVSA